MPSKNETIDTVVTSEDIQQLLGEAVLRSNDDLKLKCRRALSGNFQAYTECERIILERRRSGTWDV